MNTTDQPRAVACIRFVRRCAMFTLWRIVNLLIWTGWRWNTHGAWQQIDLGGSAMILGLWPRTRGIEWGRDIDELSEREGWGLVFGPISIGVTWHSPNDKTVATEGVAESPAEAAQPSSQK